MSKTMRRIEGDGHYQRTQPYKRKRAHLSNMKADYAADQSDQLYL